MAAVQSDTTLFLHEVKGNPAPVPYTKIVEAYGLRKCPKLIEQIAGSNLEIRVNALAVLCDEFNNPFSIVGCAEVGAIRILADMVIDPDYMTRKKASEALAVVAKHSNGIKAILDDEVVESILKGLLDPSENVRINIYECLYQISTVNAGVNACVAAQATISIVDAIGKESHTIKSLLLKIVYNIVGSDQGRSDAMGADVVNICINILKENNKVYPDVVTNAARTLGFLCYDEAGKSEAIDNEAISSMVGLLKQPMPTETKRTTTMALMAITSTDEGKRQIFTTGAVEILVALLNEDDRIIKLNALKIMANAAVFPPVRSQLLQDHGCGVLLQRILQSDDELLKRHAGLTIELVNWTP